MSLPSGFLVYQERVSAALEAWLPADAGAPRAVNDAMRYAVLTPSKRVRAVLVLVSAEMTGHAARAMPVACAIEAIHAASLVLDDLPSMDDAPVRRGQPATHITFGEPIAILAAFGLLNSAYARIAEAYAPDLARRLTTLLSDAVGLDGLIAGQAEDVLATGESLTFATLERIHRRKTGVLFSAAAAAGAFTSDATDDDVAALTAYAKNLGLAFQIVDDLLDVAGTEETTGKSTGRDARKTTFVSFSGVAGARQLAGELCRTAVAALSPFGRRAARLVELADFVANRTA